eukprot:587144-Amphidinium_carterae.1
MKYSKQSNQTASPKQSQLIRGPSVGSRGEFLPAVLSGGLITYERKCGNAHLRGLAGLNITRVGHTTGAFPCKTNTAPNGNASEMVFAQYYRYKERALTQIINQ